MSNNHSAIESNTTFTTKVEDLVREIVIQNNILFYRIESSVEHLANVGGEDSFMPVIRIITYFEDTVSQITDVLNTEFDIVAKSSVDKKKSKVESFSYKYIQYLVGFKANRRELTEYKRSGNKKFEIQICSMLQDAWAGIEKELGYDSDSFPEEGKRDLYRVGALLEMADLEFLKIRSKFINRPVVTPQAATINEPVETIIAANTHTTPVPAHTVEPQPGVKIDQTLSPAIGEIATPEHKAVIAIPAAQPIVPQRAMPAQSPAGLAPKPAIVEVLQDGTTVEQKNVVIDKKVRVQTVPELPAESKSVTEPDITNIVSKPIEEQTEPAPVQPVIQQTFNVEHLKVDTVANMKVSVGESIEKAVEVNTGENPVPFFEDLIIEEQTKTVKSAPLDENAPITEASLREYVMKSKLLKEIDKKLAERIGAKINPEIDIEGDMERLRFLKVYTLKQLHDRLKDNNTDIISFAEKWIGKDNGGSFDSGISLFYLEYLLVGKKNDPVFAVEYIVKFISDNDYSARYIIPTYNSIRKTEALKFLHLTL